MQLTHLLVHVLHVTHTRCFAAVQKHALVMGNTWGLLIPLTILIATLRHKKQGWWFHLHRPFEELSLVLVVSGAILGRRMRINHPPVTVAGKLHKVAGYTALSFICLQVAGKSALARSDAFDCH